MLLLETEPIALWTLIVTIAGTVIAFVAMIAAILAAKYAKDAPTRLDFKRLETHAAATSGHLERQNRREELNTAASRVSIAVEGRSPQDEPLEVRITLQDPTVRLIYVDMRSESGTLYGSGSCDMKEPDCYVAHLESRKVQNWYNGGIQKGNASHLWLRVFMTFEEGGEGFKDMPVTILPTQIGDDRKPGYSVHVWQLTGEA